MDQKAERHHWAVGQKGSARPPLDRWPAKQIPGKCCHWTARSLSACTQQQCSPGILHALPPTWEGVAGSAAHTVWTALNKAGSND